MISGRKEYSRTSRYGHLSDTDSYGQFPMSREILIYFLLKKTSIIPILSNTDNGHEISAPESNFIKKLNLFITDTTVIRCRSRIPIDQVNLHRMNLVFDPLLPFFVLFFNTMFVSFFNLRIILFMCDLGTQLKSCRKKIKGRQSFQHRFITKRKLNCILSV